MEFKPDVKLKKMYFLYSLWATVPLAGISVILSFLHVIGMLFSLIALITLTSFLSIWIPRFYNSVKFRIEEDHAYARYGVWWVKEKRVPYSLVSQVRVRQGPVQRKLNLANVDVFTPATGALRSEVTFFQLNSDEAQEVQEAIRVKVGLLSPSERKAVEVAILEELKKIRELLEKKQFNS